MNGPRFHPRGRYRPRSTFEVNLAPARTPRLGAPRGRQRDEEECKPRRAKGFNTGQRLRRVAVVNGAW